MKTLFSEYLVCGGNWLSSTLLLKTTSSSSTEVRGKEEFVRFCDLKKRVGKDAAQKIREQKRLLQSKASPSETPYVMPHPDMDSEDTWRLDICMCCGALVAQEACNCSFMLAGLGAHPGFPKCGDMQERSRKSRNFCGSGRGLDRGANQDSCASWIPDRASCMTLLANHALARFSSPSQRSGRALPSASSSGALPAGPPEGPADPSEVQESAKAPASKARAESLKKLKQCKNKLRELKDLKAALEEKKSVCPGFEGLHVMAEVALYPSLHCLCCFSWCILHYSILRSGPVRNAHCGELDAHQAAIVAACEVLQGAVDDEDSLEATLGNLCDDLANALIGYSTAAVTIKKLIAPSLKFSFKFTCMPSVYVCIVYTYIYTHMQYEYVYTCTYIYK